MSKKIFFLLTTLMLSVSCRDDEPSPKPDLGLEFDADMDTPDLAEMDMSTVIPGDFTVYPFDADSAVRLSPLKSLQSRLYTAIVTPYAASLTGSGNNEAFQVGSFVGDSTSLILNEINYPSLFLLFKDLSTQQRESLRQNTAFSIGYSREETAVFQKNQIPQDVTSDLSTVVGSFVGPLQGQTTTVSIDSSRPVDLSFDYTTDDLASGSNAIFSPINLSSMRPLWGIADNQLGFNTDGLWWESYDGLTMVQKPNGGGTEDTREERSLWLNSNYLRVMQTTVPQKTASEIAREFRTQTNVFSCTNQLLNKALLARDTADVGRCFNENKLIMVQKVSTCVSNRLTGENFSFPNPQDSSHNTFASRNFYSLDINFNFIHMLTGTDCQCVRTLSAQLNSTDANLLASQCNYRPELAGSMFHYTGPIRVSQQNSTDWNVPKRAEAYWFNKKLWE